MRPITESRTFPKSVPAVCRSGDTLDGPLWEVLSDLLSESGDRGRCFWLGMMYTGCATFEIGGRVVEAAAPCFICLDDRATPRLLSRSRVRCDSVYFDPTFININMTTERVHASDYGEIAALYDLFLLKPFTDSERFVFPMFDECMAGTRRMFAGILQEFTEQTDWYWSCRSRSYFMELMFLLEQAYGYFVRSESESGAQSLRNTYLQRAVLFIESHYMESLSLTDITKGAGINHTTLTNLFKTELGMTPVAFLWHHRIRVAKKQLEFTALPIKDVSARCGFKTVQHFSRKFEEATGYSPLAFRNETFKGRLRGLGTPCGCQAGSEAFATASACACPVPEKKGETP